MQLTFNSQCFNAPVSSHYVHYLDGGPEFHPRSFRKPGPNAGYPTMLSRHQTQTPNGDSSDVSTQLSVNERDVTVIKVPQAVAQAWMSQQPGTVLAVETESGSRIVLPKKLGLSIGELDLEGSFDRRNADKQLTESRFVLDDNCIQGTVKATKVFVPNMKKSTYRNWASERLKSAQPPPTPRLLSAEEAAQLQISIRDNTNPENRLFHYLPRSENQNDWPRSSGCQNKSIAEMQRQLFALFERKGATGVTIKEAHGEVGVSLVQVKNLLESIAELSRERHGKKHIYLLKREYRK